MTHFTSSVFLDPASSSYCQVHSLTLYTCLSFWWAVYREMAPRMRLKQSMSIKSPHKLHGQQPLYVFFHKKEKNVLARYSDQEKAKMTGSKTLYKVPKIINSDWSKWQMHLCYMIISVKQDNRWASVIIYTKA